MSEKSVIPSNDSIGPNDVLLGRGGKTNSHVGNQRFRTIVTEHQTEYLNARKCDKILIARKIVATVQQRGGRFLKRSSGGSCVWELVDDKKAQLKTSQALREGLNVRNKTKRPEKQFRHLIDKTGIKTIQGKGDSVVVSGTVMTMSYGAPSSPALVSVSTTTGANSDRFPDIPDLADEYACNLFFHYHTAPIDDSSLDDLFEV